MRNFQLGAIMLFSFLLFACGSDDDWSDFEDNAGLGRVEITITGDIEGNRSGLADFDYMDFGSMQEWELSFHDYNPQTFDFNLMLLTMDGTDLSSTPQPGTYEIGFEANDPTVFFGSFTNIVNEEFENAVEYDTFTSEGGVLTIDSSSSERVSGSFSFTAHARDENFNETGVIHISGTFSANKRLIL